MTLGQFTPAKKERHFGVPIIGRVGVKVVVKVLVLEVPAGPFIDVPTALLTHIYLNVRYKRLRIQ